jgi:dTDP-4-amino-4,6-dideoxygalactose transaminase
MRKEQLALLGGPRTITEPFKPYNSIGTEEVEAAKSVVESGILSQFLGSWDADFFGGPKVQEFERACESYFGVKHAITVNSWTSGLIAAVGALNTEPGDEIIVSPWTMCASATAILHWNAIPVFADIEKDTFCLDVASVEKNITPYTKAIMAVDIFGHSADVDALMEIGERYGIKIITDTAQSPGALYKGRYAGTAAHIGGYSLNYHKHIHTGEGGIIVTNDDELADRSRLIRNHAEAVVAGKGVANLANMVGFNFRLGEIESAIGLAQLGKLAPKVKERQDVAAMLTNGLKNLPGLRTPSVKPDCTHAYYVFAMVLDIAALGVSRDQVCSALQAEGISGLFGGYANVHMLPMYQKKIAYGSAGFPWSSDICKRDVSYAKGICPVAEKLHDEEFLGFEMCLHDLSVDDVGLIIQAFQKVWSQLDDLRH